VIKSEPEDSDNLDNVDNHYISVLRKQDQQDESGDYPLASLIFMGPQIANIGLDPTGEISLQSVPIKANNNQPIEYGAVWGERNLLGIVCELLRRTGLQPVSNANNENNMLSFGPVFTVLRETSSVKVDNVCTDFNKDISSSGSLTAIP
jgi:hypothetical protein